jgi:error-prone DNA polymerase
MPEPADAGLPGYAELHALSAFSFQRGASLPDELAERAAALGYAALAITDECSLAGVVRAHAALRELAAAAGGDAPGGGRPPPPKLIVGAEFALDEPPPAGAAAPPKLVLLACDRAGYGNLAAFITDARMRAAKGRYRVTRADFDAAGLDGCIALLLASRGAAFEAVAAQAFWFARRFAPGAPQAAATRGLLGVELLHALDDARWLHQLCEAGRLTGLALVACGDVQMHHVRRKPLHDVLAAIGAGLPVQQCGTRLQPHAERHLRPLRKLAQIYPRALLDATLAVAARCRFSLDELRYEYPDEVVPPGETPAGYLRRMTWEGAAHRFAGGIPAAVQRQIEHELALIAELRYEKYFLTVFDIVRFARGRGILCQGRGSAANSAVCYCLGITEVDPARMNVLFERFISRERGEPPDIDVDFEHQRREEVIQYLYAKYGRRRTALVATVIRYRTRSALRDVGRALGIDAALVDAVARDQRWWDASRLDAAGLAPLLAACAPERRPGARLLELWLALARELLGFPRHLSQHVGGFVIAQGELARLVPIENAAMPERSVIQWDKDDVDALGLLKVDVLALGMLTALRRALDFIGQRRGHTVLLQDIPAEDPATYAMIGRADTVGVFQIESRAQMSMLPRLKPRCFYDLVIEVAIVRPGPIQGGMVHPYLRRRQGLEPVSYPSAALEAALGRTLGVPIFQEQVMQVAILAAGFSPGEADQLRRSMAAWKRKGGIERFYHRVIDGMTERGYERAFAESIFRQIEGFGEYGFPESHAASFALLTYASCWIKCHEPACFLAALLDSQPLGFYGPSQLVQDAQRHGVEVRPPCVLASDWHCTLEDLERPGQPAVRLGLRLIAGLKQASALRIVDARRADGGRPFIDVDDLARRAALDAQDLRLLAAADALAVLAGPRRAQVWEASAAALRAPALLADAPVLEPDEPELPPAPEGEDVVFDYAATALSLRRHPLALLRPQLAARRLLAAAALRALPDRALVRACGLVTMRQQPETAKGVVFVTLEDETGSVNVIVWKRLRERQRRELLHARLLAVYGQWQSSGGVQHLIAARLVDLTPLLAGLSELGALDAKSRDFR